MVSKLLQKAMTIFLILFGIYLLYQIVLKIIGGSWAIEEVILALNVLMIGFMFSMNSSLTKLKTEHSHLRRQFMTLAGDFKGHIGKQH